MKEWFKARNVWGAALLGLSDEEAGIVAKAIWSYTINGEITQIEGAGKGIFAMILMTLGQDEEHDAIVSAKRSDAAKSMHMQANANNCKQMQAIASNCSNKNKNKSKNKEQESESESEFMTDAEAEAINHDHDRILDAAEDAGFKMSNDVRASLIALYADHGLQKIIDGLKSCVDHGAPNLAYLKAVLKGEPKKTPGIKTVTAQQYAQRDYTGEQEEAFMRMVREIKGEGA